MLVIAAAFAAKVFVDAYNELVGATGLMRTFPVPLYTLTSPSPLTAEPISVFVDLSTVKSRFEDQHTARLPSILRVAHGKSLLRLLITHV